MSNVLVRKPARSRKLLDNTHKEKGNKFHEIIKTYWESNNVESDFSQIYK